jgi:type I restriction enzyme S subunit
MIATEYCKKVFDGTHDSPKPVENGRLLITSKHIANRSLDISSAYLISEEDFENVNKRSQVHQWDILFSMIGTVGNVYIETSEKIDYAIKNMGVFSCQNKEKAYWLYYYLQSPLVQAKIDALMAGAVQKFVPLGFLRGLDIPEYTENSKKVVQVLSALDDKIALNKKMNQKLEAMSKRLYDYWFVQYDFPDKNGHPYKTTGGPMTYNPTLKREIPVGWEVKTIGDYLKIGNGRDHSKLADGPYPVYGSGGIMRYVAEYLHDGETVLFPRKGTLNNVMYRNEPLWTVDTMFYTSVLVPHSALFVFYSAKMFDFERLNTGTGVPSMTSDIIKKLPIISPDRQTLEQFDKTVAKLYNQIHHNEKEISRLTKLRDKLLPLLMNGQVIVE